MLKFARFALIPIKVNYHTCPFRAKYKPLRASPPISSDMKKGVIKAYETFVHDYNSNSSFQTKPYVTSRLGYMLDTLERDDGDSILMDKVLHVQILDRTVTLGYTEEQWKIGGYYSKEEAIEQLIAGMCGPESPMWSYLPRKETMNVLYTTNERTDLLSFERNMENDGDWVISNLNKVLV